MRFKTLDTVVKYICEVGGRDFNHKNYGVVLKVCVNTLSDLNLFTQIPNYKTVKLVVNKNLTARMPEDTLRPLKIGKLIDGRISEIRYAQSIVMGYDDTKDHCDCVEPTDSAVNDRNYTPYENFGYMPVNAGLSGIYAAFLGYNELRGGKAYYEVYGQRPYPALNGYFNYDLVKGIIKFEMGHTEPDDEYLFMYRTEMQEVDGSKVVPVETENMLLYRCKELIFAKSSIEEQRNRATYELEYSRIKRLYNKMTLEEWEAAIGGYKFSSIKR